MGAKYSNQATSGYNASPPSDDGTQSASNLITWAGIKSKLVDPVKTDVDNINAALVSAFDYSVRQISSSDNTVAADHMRTVEIAPTATTGVTVSLGDATTMTNLYRVYVKNSSSYIQTVGRVTSGDTIDGVAGNVSLLPGETVPFTTNAAASGYLRVGGIIWTNFTRPTLNINPNWLFDQINEGALYTVNTTSVNGPDGWSGDAVGAGVFKLRTITDPDNASLKCLEISCTTADASIGATDRYEVFTAIEGYDVADLKIGTASASYVTVMVGIKSNSVTGLMGAFLTNSAGNRFYATTALTLTGTSEQLLSFNVPLDTTGTWLYTNGIGLKLGLVLAAGSNFQGTASAWTASTVHTTSAQANFMSANTNIVYVKRIHVIPGGVALAYSSQDVQRELARAQRQYYKSYDAGVVPATSTTAGAVHNSADGNAVVYLTHRYPVTMRAVPTTTDYSTTGASGKIRNTTGGVDVTPSEITTGTNGRSISGALGGASQQAQGQMTANARLS